MRRTAAVPAALLALLLPAAAHAADAPDRVELPRLTTIAEGQSVQRTATLTCRHDECSFWIGPRSRTAQALLGDFNPFLVQTVDLGKGESHAVPYRFEALPDKVVEEIESFRFVVRSSVRSTGGEWRERESFTKVRILDRTLRFKGSQVAGPAQSPVTCSAC